MAKPTHKVLAMFEGQEVMDKTEFLDAFKKQLTIILKKEQKLEQAIAEMKKTYTELQNKLGSDNSATSDKLKGIIEAELESLLRRFSAKSKELDSKMMAIKDGEDADEEVIVGKVLAQIKLPEYKEVMLDDGVKLRDKLEGLEGEERLTIKAISGLEKLLEEFKTTIPRGGTPFGGSVVHKFIDDETPTGTVNGTNKAFTWSKAPIGLQAFVNGQKMTITEDYTEAGKVTTFLTAPPTGSIVRGYYRYF